MKARPYATALPLLAVGLLTAACGNSSSPSGGSSPQATPTPTQQTVAQVFTAMQAAVKTATSVHMVGTAKDGSKTLTLDVSFQGGNTSGTFSEGGKAATILLIGNKSYIKIDNAFLKLAGVPLRAVVCARVCGKYVLVPASQAAGLAGSFDMAGLNSQFVSSLPASFRNDTTDQFTPATLNGQAVLKATQGQDVIEVAASGTPYPVFISEAGQGSLTFSEWNAVPPITPPPASKVISLGSL